MKTSGIKGLIIAAVFIIAVQIVLGLIIWDSFDSWTDRGTFGDMFGAVNALFAGLAFAGVIVAIFLQAKELELQRKELELTRNELKGQKDQLKNQNDTLQRQNVENTFFQMLRLHNEIVNGIYVRDEKSGRHGNVILSGRACFNNFYDKYRGIFARKLKKNNSLPPLQIIEESFAQFFGQYQQDTGHYFRNLYNIIKFVKNSEIISNKKMYTNLVRAQLSSYELALLFYNCLSSVGNQKFKPLVEEFALLKNMYLPDLIDESHADLYDSSAFAPSSETVTPA